MQNIELLPHFPQRLYRRLDESLRRKPQYFQINFNLQNCPICKKEFDNTKTLFFNNNEFLNTINVDNENFYSDHLVINKERLISTQSFKKYGPKLSNDQKRRSSFDLIQILRESNSLFSSSERNYKQVGPLKILQLPSKSPPVFSLNGSKTSLLFHDENLSYNKIKK